MGATSVIMGLVIPMALAIPKGGQALDLLLVIPLWILIFDNRLGHGLRASWLFRNLDLAGSQRN